MDQVHAGGGIEAVDELTMAPLALFHDLEECDSGLKQGPVFRAVRGLILNLSSAAYLTEPYQAISARMLLG
jgi:hypothetical protein